MSAVYAKSNDEILLMCGINFPSRLYNFLSIVDELQIGHIVSWQPHGRCFRIHNTKAFMNHTKPSWFTYKKYSSFQRQLNIYGFIRITSGLDKNAYYHQYFLRGHPHLLEKIERVPLKKNDPSHSSVPQIPQDFSSMPALVEPTSTSNTDHKPKSQTNRTTNLHQLNQISSGQKHSRPVPITTAGLEMTTMNHADECNVLQSTVVDVALANRVKNNTNATTYPSSILNLNSRLRQFPEHISNSETFLRTLVSSRHENVLFPLQPSFNGNPSSSYFFTGTAPSGGNTNRTDLQLTLLQSLHDLQTMNEHLTTSSLLLNQSHISSAMSTSLNASPISALLQQVQAPILSSSRTHSNINREEQLIQSIMIQQAQQRQQLEQQLVAAVAFHSSNNTNAGT